MIKKKGIFSVPAVLIIVLISISLAAVPISLDKNKLKESLKDMLLEKLSEKILEGVAAAEQKLRNATYFDEILDDFSYFGINPRETVFTTRVLEIYNQYKEAYEKDRDQKESSPEEKKHHIRDLLQDNLESLILSSLDESSQEIIGDLKSLIEEGQEKIASLDQAREEINLSDVDTEISEILEKYGFDGDWVFRFKELETNIKLITDKYGDYYRAYSIISEGMDAKNPGEKIHALFILGSEFGGKVPVLGKFIELYFKVGLEYLEACNRLSASIRSREQYCVGTGSHAGIEGWAEDLRSRIFNQAFPDTFTSCPLGPAGIFRDIYKNMEPGQENRLYFWIEEKKIFIEGNPKHGGDGDIRELIKWLRKNNYAEYATNLEFISRAYNKPPGFLKYRTTAEKIVRDIRKSILFIYDQLNICADSEAQMLIMNMAKAHFFKLLLTQEKIDWPEIKRFPPEMVGEIVDRLLYWKYVQGIRDYFPQIENIKSNLDKMQPVEINGYVKDPHGQGLEDIKVSVFPINKVFNIQGPCCQLTTGKSGVFRFYVLLDKNCSQELHLQARGWKNTSKTKILMVTANKQPAYTLTLIMKSDIEEREGLIMVPTSVNLKIGESVTLSVFEKTASGQLKDLSGLAKWEPSREFHARKKGEFTISACFSAESPYPNEQLSASISVEKPIASLSIEPESVILKPNETVMFSAMAIYEDKTTEDITDMASWNPGPRFMAEKPGNFSVFARFQGKSQKASIRVEELQTGDEEKDKPETDFCSELEKKFYQAIKAGQLGIAQILLATAIHCDFYSSGFANLQLAREQQVEKEPPRKPPSPARDLPEPKDDKKIERLPTPVPSTGRDLAGVWDTTGGWVINIHKTGVNTYSGILTKIYTSKTAGLHTGEQVLQATRTGRDHYTLYVAYRIPEGKKWMKGSGILQGDRLIAGRRQWKRIR